MSVKHQVDDAMNWTKISSQNPIVMEPFVGLRHNPIETLDIDYYLNCI